MRKTKNTKLKLVVILIAIVCFAISYIQSNAMSYMIYNDTWNFDSSSSTQTWTAPESDRYTITMYAGAGGNNGTKTGAKGNYIYALVDLNIGDKLYMNIGAQGAQDTAGSETLIMKNANNASSVILKTVGGGQQHLVQMAQLLV